MDDDAYENVLKAEELVRSIDVPADPQIASLVLKAQRLLHEIGNRIANVGSGREE